MSEYKKPLNIHIQGLFLYSRLMAYCDFSFFMKLPKVGVEFIE